MTHFFMYMLKTNNKQTAAMVHVSDRFKHSCLHLNVNKTVFMFFLRKPTETHQPDVFVKGEKLKVVSDFKYLGIILDSNLSFKKAC